MPLDRIGPDARLRDALSGLLPTDIETPTEQIHARIGRLRRRGQMRVALASMGVGLLAVGTAYALPSGSSQRRVRVEVSSTLPSKPGPAVVPTTRFASPTTHPSAPATTPRISTPSRPSVIVPPAVPQTTPPSPTPGTTPHVAPPVTVPQPKPTPTTVAPAPAWITVTLVLDDTGLHVPATQVAPGAVTLRFFDQRTDISAGGHARIDVTPLDSQYKPMSINRPWRDPDMYAHFDAAITYDALGGDVTYRAYSTDTSQQLGQVETTTFVAH